MSLTVVQAFRFCEKCNSLFYEGKFEPRDTPKGVCPAGGAHKAIGLHFEIPAHATAGPNAQNRWRSCQFCWAMFFEGFHPQLGKCPDNARGHRREQKFNFNFTLNHEVPETPRAQTLWRFCNKCFVMFYDGFASKGRCAGGDGHTAQGFIFVLPHLGH